MSSALRIAELEQQNAHLSGQLAALATDHAALKKQLDWFKRQVFGAKSEKRLDIDPQVQGNLLAGLGVTPTQPLPPIPTETVTYQRKKLRDNSITDTLRESGAIVATLAPPAVLEKCVADVSLLAGLLIDKFQYHLPLYRQHQRLEGAGFRLSRASLTNWSSRAIELLAPIVEAQSQHVRESRVVAMDETPIKAGRKEKGKMRQAYFWPIYGEDDEVVFHYAASRAHEHVSRFLGAHFTGTLQSDGYEAYARYAEKNAAMTHAGCWAHCRRHIEQATDAEPQAATEALALIARLYHHEQTIRERGLMGEQKLAYRTEHSEPVVSAFWCWCEAQCGSGELLPSNPLSKALNYARERRTQLKVFLSDPAVPIDTNHLERALRAIPMGKKNWLFCWTEVGARQVGIIQSLIVTCRLHGIDVYTYLVDVLQRVSIHPAKNVVDLTPRVWKTKFAHAPMKSDIALADQ